MTLGQCEGEVRAGPGFSCQVTLAVFPGSLWGAGFPHTSSSPSPSVESSQSTGGKGARGWVWTKAAQPCARSPLAAALQKSQLAEFCSAAEVPVPSPASGGGTTLANDHGMASSPQSELQSSRVSSSSDTNVFFPTKKEIFKGKPREIQFFCST